MNKKLILFIQESIVAWVGVKPYKLKIEFLNSFILSLPFINTCFRIKLSSILLELLISLEGLAINPLTLILTEFRQTLLWGEMINLQDWGMCLIFAVVFAISGYVWFMKTKKSFADVM